MLRKQIAFAAFAIASIGGISSASADFVFDLGAGNAAISDYTGPYAQVDVHLTDSTHATVTFTALVGPSNAFEMGAQGAVAVNVNATSWTLSNLTPANTFFGFTPGPLSDGGSGNEDGWGTFNQTINSFDGYTHSSTSISLDLTNMSGTWADASSVLTANNGGNLAAAHIFVCDGTSCDTSVSALATGYATDGGTIIIPGGGGASPEPASLTLLGGGLAALGLLRRRSKK